MEISKYKKLYLFINNPIMFVFFILLFTPFFIIDKVADVYYVGIVARIIMGIWFIFNGIWNACTDYYSILKNNRVQKNNKTPKWMWWIIFAFGIGCIITAFLGYGFNGVKKPMQVIIAGGLISSIFPVLLVILNVSLTMINKKYK